MNSSYSPRKYCFFVTVLLLVTTGCDSTNYQRIDDDFEFGYTDRTDYTNVYCHDLPVIPGGCDEAKWNDSLIVACGRQRFTRYGWSPLANTAKGELLYFIIHKTAYLQNTAAQELSDGFEGPLSEDEFLNRDPLPEQGFRNTKF